MDNTPIDKKVVGVFIAFRAPFNGRQQLTQQCRRPADHLAMS
jgi:hypothetical protein